MQIMVWQLENFLCSSRILHTCYYISGINTENSVNKGQWESSCQQVVDFGFKLGRNYKFLMLCHTLSFKLSDIVGPSL